MHDLVDALRAFVREREWERFQTPKNLAMALAVEAAELMEHFQWLEGEESRRLPAAARAQVAEELADVFIYLLRLADELGIDLGAAARRKMVKNAAKYPVAECRGRAARRGRGGGRRGA